MTEEGGNRGVVILLAFALLGALILLGTLVALVVIRLADNGGGQAGAPTVTLGPAVTVAATLPTGTPSPTRTTATPITPATLPVDTPEPGAPTAVVTAENGVNIRSGPGEEYPILFVAPFGSAAEVVGRSADGQWWALQVEGAPNNQAWVSARFVDVTGGESVPILLPPPTPTPRPSDTPQATDTPTASATPSTSFSASRTAISVGESSVLSWNVQNVLAVYLYPVGADYALNGVPGVGSREVRPMVTTTYELRIVQPGNVIELQQITISVGGGLDRGRWLLIGYLQSPSNFVSIVEGSEVSATFAGGSLSGSGGCNSYSAGYQAFESVLQVGAIVASQMTCNEPAGVMEQEAEFFSLLGGAATFEIAGGQLFVRDTAGQTVLLFGPG